jgi:hypothetical protein
MWGVPWGQKSGGLTPGTENETMETEEVGWSWDRRIDRSRAEAGLHWETNISTKRITGVKLQSGHECNSRTNGKTTETSTQTAERRPGRVHARELHLKISGQSLSIWTSSFVARSFCAPSVFADFPEPCCPEVTDILSWRRARAGLAEKTASCWTFPERWLPHLQNICTWSCEDLAMYVSGIP